MSETIAKIRHQHYEEKRKGKIELLERSLKNGLLADLITKKSPMSPNKSYLSSYPLQNHSRLINQSPPSHGAGTRTLMKHSNTKILRIPYKKMLQWRVEPYLRQVGVSLEDVLSLNHQTEEWNIHKLKWSLSLHRILWIKPIRYNQRLSQKIRKVVKAQFFWIRI